MPETPEMPQALPLNTQEIRDAALEMIKNNPGGIRIRDIVSEIVQKHPGTNEGTIRVQVSYMARTVHSDKIERPSHGIYRPIESDLSNFLKNESETSSENREEDFYEPFAQFLVDDLEECSFAISVGRMKTNGRWGNPDIVGIYEADIDDLVRFETEITSAELKIDPGASITGFFQAVLFGLFSHKTYLVLPKTVPLGDKKKVSSLCELYNIGLVYFDERNSNNPEFQTEMRAKKSSPNMFFLNEYMRKIREFDNNKFRELRGLR